MQEALLKSLRPCALSRWSCNCLHLCKSDYGIGLTNIFTRFRNENDLSATEGRLPACAWSDIACRRNPSPPHDRIAFASSILPCPHAYWLALRLAFPHGRRTGLPCSVSVTRNGVGARSPPVAWDAHDKEGASPCTRSSALLAQACQHLWLVVYDDVYRWVDRGRGPLLAF